jgi:hypothetical protein
MNDVVVNRSLPGWPVAAFGLPVQVEMDGSRREGIAVGKRKSEHPGPKFIRCRREALRVAAC